MKEGICNCVQDNITDSFTYDDGKWCCKSTHDECKIDEVDNHGFVMSVTCTGKAILLEEQCQSQEGPICNHYPDDEFRHFWAARSYLDICNDNRYTFDLLS